MAELWLTADTHFFHRSMPRDGKGWRARYADVDEMNTDLIERWNATVRPADTVWHLGDFALGDPADFLPLVGRLHGTIHLVAGNHDEVWSGHRGAHKHQRAWIMAGFASIQAYARLRIAGRSVLLAHLPYLGDHLEEERYQQYRLRDRGLPLLCGHVHDAWAVSGRQFNVGVDVRQMRPVNVDEVAAWVTGVHEDPSPLAATG